MVRFMGWGQECTTMNFLAVHCQAPYALQSFKCSFEQAQSPSPVHSTKEKKQENPETKREKPNSNNSMAGFTSSSQNKRKLESSKNILDQTNTIEMGGGGSKTRNF